MWPEKDDIELINFSGLEYRVFEFSDGIDFDDEGKEYKFSKPFWFAIGSSYSHIAEAMNKMLELQKTYGKYGRKYTVKTRSISEWTSI